MGYLVVDNFSSGVNRQRPIYAAAQGTLWEGINGHFTRGGDFEKRKSFVAKYSLPKNTFGLAAAGSNLYVFGADPSISGIPSGVTYQQLRHPDGLMMSKVLSVDLFDGKIYAIAQYSDSSVMHFYDGALVTDWVNGVVRTAMTNNSGIATHLGDIIALDTAYIVSVASNVITIDAAVVGTAFTISAETENKTGGTSDQTAVVATTTPNIPGISEVLALGSFQITGGTASAGTNKISSIKVDGIEILNTAVDWATSNSGTATNVAAQINSYNSTPEYTASASGSTVTISAAAGSGAGANGKVVSITVGGNVTVGSIVNMDGGVTAVSGQRQRSTVTIGGTFEVGDKFTVVIDDKKFGSDGNPTKVATLVKTLRNKLYASVDSILNFSGVGTAIGWNRDDDAGAGFINIANHDAGSESLTGLAPYQGNLAIFSPGTIQVWAMRDDDAANTPLQFLQNTGTRSPRSVIGYGDIDVFYLNDSGIRSLRARDASNAAAVNDVGSAIDPLVTDWLMTLSDEVVANAVSIVEPIDGRFWIAIGSRIFVFSYFPSAKISAWSWYEPGFSVSEFAKLNKRIYARSGDTIYLYGGDNNTTYDSCEVTIQFPYLTAGKPGSYKQLIGFDIAATGTWDCEILTDPRDQDRKVVIGELSGVTYMDGDSGVVGLSTHVAPRLIHEDAGYASLSNIALYYEGAQLSE